MNTIIDFLKIIDRHTIGVAILSVIFTFFCRQFNIIFEMPTNLIGIAVIFPLVFTIGSAYKRREDALRYFASLKAYAAALYYAYRDWPPIADGLEAEGGGMVHELLTAVADYCQDGEDRQEQKLRRVYNVFSTFSHFHEKVRQSGVPANEISRANQYLRGLMVEFESMKNFARYRTPIALRAYSRLFLTLFPILFAPNFAYIAYPEYPIVGYVVAIVYSLVLVSLDNIQDHLENPYDGVGTDDLRLNIADTYVNVVTDKPEQPQAVLA